MASYKNNHRAASMEKLGEFEKQLGIFSHGSVQ
jgi:hypothetical protein